MSERRGTKGLELWCRRMTEGYPGVKIDNMTTSWRDGLAFCALIHHFRPDLIDFTKLNKNDIYHNNELAFRIAEIHLGIPALLEPEDMVEFAVPDRLSILTYLSQFYQTFTGPQGSSQARIAPKRPQSPPDHNIVSPPSTSPPSKVAFLGAGKIRRDPCAKCGLPVFIAERLNVEKLLYHRTCFRCARCNSQLTLDNYYATENGDFCCETCPDEEKPLVTKVEGQEEQSVLTRSMSDEQKTANLRVVHDDQDEYSAEFETALEFPQDSSLKRNSSLTSEQTAVFTEARTHFMLTQMESGSESDNEDNVPPDLPTVEKPVLTSGADSNSELFDVQFDSGFSNNNIKVESVNIESNNKNNSDSLTADITENIVTKDVVTADETPPTSMVKARLQLFESNVANSRNKVTKSDDFNKEKPIEFIDEEDSSTLDIKQQNNEDSVLESSDNKTNPEQISPQNITTDTSVITILDSSEEERKINEEFVDDKQDNTTETSIITVLDSSEETAKETVPVKTEPETKSQNTEEDYPVDLNPFGDDDEDDKANASKDSLNPFDEVPEKLPPIPSPRAKKRIIPSSEDKEITGSPECLATIYIERISVNPFESDEEEDVVKVKPPLPANRKKRVLEAPKISLNPFWESGEENEEEVKQPVPTPRSSRNTMDLPRDSGLEGSSFGSSNSLSSGSNFSGGTLRKKKPAPKPPVILTESSPSSLTSSPSQSVQHSPCATLKYRKAKKAPLPPGFASTPIEGKKINEGLRISLSSLDFDSQKLFASNLSPQSENLEVEKNTKDEVNRNRQSQIPINSPSSSENSLSLGAPNKSTYGKWKRRKGLAPSRPVPQKRTIKSLPVEDISKELGVIEIQLQGLERQGVRIEQIIREKCEGSENDEQTETSLPADAEDLILQLFELVNEKNELFRKQAELMYLKRQQRLEEEHADVEYQIRCLMLQPEANKTDSDKAREEELINRLVDIVERRNEIVECLEMDRVREAEEDHSITNHLNLYSMRMSEDKTPELPSSKKEKKKHKKEKRFKFKGSKIDADKDIDESETGSSQSSTEKKKKKKLILFK